jgi:hypothetical protein
MTALAALALLAAPVCAAVLWRAWRLPPKCKPELDVVRATQDAARDARDARDAYADQVRLLHDMHLAVLRSAYDADVERRLEYRTYMKDREQELVDRAAEYDSAIRVASALSFDAANRAEDHVRRYWK